MKSELGNYISPLVQLLRFLLSARVWALTGVHIESSSPLPLITTHCPLLPQLRGLWMSQVRAACRQRYTSKDLRYLAHNEVVS